ncbi:MAG: transposase [Bacilli bacterium]
MKFFSYLIYSRIIYPSSKLETFKQCQNFIEQPKFNLHDEYRALSYITEKSDYIQEKLFENSKNVIKRNSNIIYYDCTNYFFEIDQDNDLRKYGISKEHRPNPIVGMGLFMDGAGLPLSFNIYLGNQNEQKTLIPEETKIVNNFKMDNTKMILCTDAGLASYKIIQTETKSIKQDLIVTFCFKYFDYNKNIKNSQIERAKKFIASNQALRKSKNQNDYKRFINNTKSTDNGEIAENNNLSLDEDLIKNEEKYDGYYALTTNLVGDIEQILKISKGRWEIKKSFRIMKTDFLARPVNLSREDRIKVHFMTCFISLLIYRLLEKKSNYKYTTYEILKTLREMNLLESKGDGYLPEYTRTNLTDDHMKYLDLEQIMK